MRLQALFGFIGYDKEKSCGASVVDRRTPFREVVDRCQQIRRDAFSAPGTVCPRVAKQHIQFLFAENRVHRRPASWTGAFRRNSIASHISAAPSGPPNRLNSWIPVGEVTLISVR